MTSRPLREAKSARQMTQMLADLVAEWAGYRSRRSKQMPPNDENNVISRRPRPIDVRVLCWTDSTQNIPYTRVTPMCSTAAVTDTIVQPYLPGGTNVHAHLIHDSLGLPHSLYQTAARSVQPFLHGRCRILPIRYTAPPPNLHCTYIGLPYGGSADPPPEMATRSSVSFFPTSRSLQTEGTQTPGLRTDRQSGHGTRPPHALYTRDAP